MKRKRRTRLLSLFLGLSLALSPAARALTPEQAGDLLDVYYIDDVPEEVLEEYRALNPGASREEIQRHYQNYIRHNREA